ncbi:MAG TPA: FtsX-like permease family protein [Anaerolineales bacterium]|nr:FtsX-like permease family protein [Anaerolineales bacterium]
MTLYLRLAWRNIWRHRRRTINILLAMSLSLGMMMWYDGLIDGFNNAIYGNAIRVLGGNIQIHAAGYRAKVDSNPLIPLTNDAAVVQAALAHPDVISATRRIQTGGLLSNREGAFGVSIIGIDPEAEAAPIQTGNDAGKPLSLIAQNIKEGEWLTADGGDVILIGRGMADVMDLKVGDRITMVGSDIHKQNRQRTMTVVGIYDIGIPTLERQSAYIPLAEAQALFGLDGQSTEIQVNIKRLGEEDKVVAALEPALPGYEVESWNKNYPELETAINSKGAAMTIFGIIIISIAAIGILNLLLMAVYERTREIGLLGAMGLKPREIAALFVLEGALIGIVGAAAGIVVGLIINVISAQVGLDYTSYASISDYMALINSRIYPSLGLQNLPWRAATVVIISTLAAFIPAREASHREPAEALHYV